MYCIAYVSKCPSNWLHVTKHKYEYVCPWFIPLGMDLYSLKYKYKYAMDTYHMVCIHVPKHIYGCA